MNQSADISNTDHAHQPAHLIDLGSSRLSVAQLAQVRTVLESAEAHDGVEPFGEAFLRGLDRDSGHRHVLAVAGDGDGGNDGDDGGSEVVVGLVASDGDAAELAVHPDFRGQGIGAQLNPEVEGTPVWAHGDTPGAQALARRVGRRRTRELLQMTVTGDALQKLADQPVTADDGIAIVDYPAATQQLGQERVDQAWVDTNNEAFSWHPEQGGWDLGKLNESRDTAWYDPAGVFFALDAEAMLGFHWTKWHADAEIPTGEVYVIGLAERARGKGLGSRLTTAGIQHLIKSAAEEVLLYVEGDNESAVRTYKKLGFQISRRDVMYG